MIYEEIMPLLERLLIEELQKEHGGKVKYIHEFKNGITLHTKSLLSSKAHVIIEVRSNPVFAMLTLRYKPEQHYRCTSLSYEDLTLNDITPIKIENMVYDFIEINKR